MFRRIYLSPIGNVISLIFNFLFFLKKPFMVYGYRDKVSGDFRKRTRFSSSTTFVERDRIAIGDDVWIGHYCFIDGSGGLKIEEGVQIGAGSCLVTHGSHNSIRLCGKHYIELETKNRPGYSYGRVEIGRYAFIGVGVLILPGVIIGKGCLIAAGSVVAKDVPDFAVARGVPAMIVGDVRDIDKEYFNSNFVQENYFDRDTINDYITKHYNNGNEGERS